MSQLASMFGSQLLSFATSTAQPVIAQFQQNFRYDLGWNDVARHRNQVYDLNRKALNRPPVDAILDFSQDYGPVILDVGQAIQSFNRSTLNARGQTTDAAWRRLVWNLGSAGIDIQTTPDDTGWGRYKNPIAREWAQQIDMSSTSTPIDQVVREYYLSLALPDGEKTVGEAELRWHLEKHQYRRKQDRDRLLRPQYPWNLDAAQRLVDAGRLEPGEYANMLAANGITAQRDRERLHSLAAPLAVDAILKLLTRGEITEQEAARRMALAGVTNDFTRDTLMRFRWRVPSPGEFIGGAVRRLWDEELAARYSLDDGLDQSPLAIFFARRQGTAEAFPPLPGQPAGETDWAKLDYRSGRKLPGIGECFEMQHRLRSQEGSLDVSAVDGVRPWTADNTRDVLRMQGFPEPIIERFLGLVNQPINIRLINHILGPYSTHPEVRAAAVEAFGPGVDWIESAMLDHGFSAPYAKVASVGIRAQADDRDNAERKEHERQLRQANRASWLRQYKLGLVGRNETHNAIIDPFFTAAMADQTLAIIDAELDDAVKESGVKALHEAWMTGKMTALDIAQSLTQLGISDARKNQYIGEWTWNRTEKTRMLTTGEILAALKSGLLSVPNAAFRLVNLGWSSPDALVEIAQVERDLQASQARTAQAAATHQQAAAMKTHAEEIKAQKAAQAQADKERKERVHVEKQVDLAAHEKLLATSQYYAKVHASNANYAEADKASNEEKKAAEIQRQIAAYQKYLLDQLHLIQQSPEVANVVKPIDAQVASGPTNTEGHGGPATPTTPAGG